MTMGDMIQRRYPRLIRSMCRAGHLTEAETIRALVEYQVFGIHEGFGSNSVERLGGQLAAICLGIRDRHATASHR